MSAPQIVLYMHVHQPYRVRPYSVFDTAKTHDYFVTQAHAATTNNESVFKKVADKSYRPMAHLLRDLLQRHPGFAFSLSITGTFIDQAQQWAPDVLEDFKRLVATGRVEIVAETYHHSLAFFYDTPEFERQVTLHAQKIQQLFGVTPTVFRNTELAYNDSLAQWAQAAGYKGILAEGWGPVLGSRSPNNIYRPADTKHISLLLKNYQLSDDIAFRFGDKAWNEWPLTANKFSDWLDTSAKEGPIINLFMDFETFGEHQWADTGIFTFFEQLTAHWLGRYANGFATISQAITSHQSVGEISMPNTVTWADNERDLSAWNGNSMQAEALRHLYALSSDIMLTGDQSLIEDWRRLQASDAFYYMSTKWAQDGDVHAYFSPYNSPYDAFLYYINVIRDLRWRLMQQHSIGRLHG